MISVQITRLTKIYNVVIYLQENILISTFVN